MNRSKKLLAGMITLLVIFLLLMGATIILWYVELVKNPLYVTLEIIALVLLVGFSAFLFALYINEQRK